MGGYLNHKIQIEKLGIKIKTISPYNHGSLTSDSFIKATSTMLAKWLTVGGIKWPYFPQTTVFAYNIFGSPKVDVLSPYQLTYGREPNSLLNVETDPNISVPDSFKDYYELLKSRFAHFHKIVFDIR